MQTATDASETQINAAALDTDLLNHAADYRADVQWLNATHVPTDGELGEDCTPPDIIAMHDPIARRAARQRAEDLRNAAKRARAAGVRVLCDPALGLHVAQDEPDSPLVYLVERDHCTCGHFAAFGRCPHVALLLDDLGQLPELDASPCLACEGDGCPACRLAA